MNPDDDAALALARQILDSTARWRPMPDLTIVIADDVKAAVGRAEPATASPIPLSNGSCTTAPLRCSSA